MSQHVMPLRPLATDRSPWLRGSLPVPGDAAISHRALMLGAMARGETVIEGLLESPDVLATARVMRALGARVEKRADGWHLMGIGAGGFLEPAEELDFGGSATALRLGMGLVGIYGFASRLTGDAALAARPMQAMFEPLEALGISVLDHQDGRLPITLRGPRLRVPPLFRVPWASSAFKDCVLLAAVAIPGTTVVLEPATTRDHTERLLRSFGAQLDVTTDADGWRRVALAGLPSLRAQRVEVPRDPSLAAYGMVAGVIVPGSELRIDGVSINPTRSGLLQTLLEMGADIELLDRRQRGGEERADLRIRHSSLTGVVAPPARGPAMTDELPVLAVAAAFAEGDTLLQGLGAQRPGEADRLAATARGLAANGVACEIGAGQLLIRGRGRVRGGGRVGTVGDHRLAMAFLVMGMAADDQVIIDDQSPLDRRFPGFVAGFEDVGASFIRYSD
jgi:3-phosphoshikimate 1-carboxyvinyltransferase